MREQEAGDNVVEFALIIIFVAVVVIVVLTVMGGHSGGVFSNTVGGSPSP